MKTDKTLAEQVREFHEKFGHPVRTKPTIPSDEEIRFRLKLITEEYLELLRAAFSGHSENSESVIKLLIDDMDECASLLMTHCPKIDLPEFADAMGDLDYVVTGTRLVCGVDGKPIADEIHRANMDKDAVYVQTKDGYHKGNNIKPTKPTDWKPPQIEEELIRQGWEK